MRHIVLASAFALALLVGCASKPPANGSPATHLSAAPAQLEAFSAATLATNACEEQTAADYTAVTVAARHAARLVRTGKLDEAGAVTVLSNARSARMALGAACAGARLDPEQLAAAKAARTRIEQTLEEARRAH